MKKDYKKEFQKDVEREQKKKTPSLMNYIVIAFIASLVWGWIWMLAIGALWHITGWLAPVGFFPLPWILGLVTVVYMLMNSGNEEEG